MPDVETDYLIIGAGAVGLAFADTLIDEDPDCHITFVDKHAKPGGHWNDAYGFVALHQPSATYGVNSMPFPSEQVDTHGINEGMHALASGTEVLAYFEKVMNMRLLPTGRVAYYPLSEYRGDGRIVSIMSGKETTVTVRRKTVDATFYQTSVPSTHTPGFDIADGAQLVPPGALTQLWQKPDALPEHFVILGGGKTAMDTAVWLIGAGVAPDRMSWVRPRESWLLNRRMVQPGEEFFEALIGWQFAHLECAMEAEDGAEWMALMGERDCFLRIDPDADPEMFHFATISEKEIEILRRIDTVIRKGRVTAIAPGMLIFAEQTVAVPEDSLFVDCTATAVPFVVRETAEPQFQDGRIVLQPLHVPLVSLSAAIAAFLEAHFDDDETKNALGIVGPLTDTPATYPYAFMMTMMNRGIWSQHEPIGQFLQRTRLDPTGLTIASLAASGSPKLARLAQFGALAQKAMPHVQRLGMQAKALHEAG